MPNKNMPSFDFASLYPIVIKSFNSQSYDDIFQDFLRKRNKQKLMTERRKKLEKLNELYEKE